VHERGPYRAPAPREADLLAPDPHYVRAWRRRRVVGGVGICCVPIGIALSYIQPLMAAAALFSALALFLWYAETRCPRCSYRLADSDWMILWVLQRRCSHCALPYGAPRDPRRAPRDDAA